MKKSSLWKLLGFGAVLLANAAVGGPMGLLKAGLSMAGISPALLQVVLPQLAGVIKVVGCLSGVVSKFLGGNNQARLVAELVAAGLTGLGPVLASGMFANREMEAYQQEMALER